MTAAELIADEYRRFQADHPEGGCPQDFATGLAQRLRDAGLLAGTDEGDR